MNNNYPYYFNLIEEAIRSHSFKGEPAELYDPVNYMMSLGGKRLRPILVLMANDLYGGDISKAIPAALAVEVFHNFTLVHDDIMDKALIRRGKPTVHVKWNETVAILSGDLMMIKATDLLCETGANDLGKLIRRFNQTAIEVCEGQQIDMNFESQNQVAESAYIGMITLKTAVLLGCALELGAQIAGATDEEANNLYQFGKHIGIAFQIQDDILDSFGDGDQTGKKVGGDISCNKKTLLLIKAMELADEQTAGELTQLLNLPADDSEKIAGMLNVYHKLNVRDYAEQLKRQHLELAFAALNVAGGNTQGKRLLEETARDLMERMS